MVTYLGDPQYYTVRSEPHSYVIRSGEVTINPWTFPKPGEYTITVRPADYEKVHGITVLDYLREKIRLQPQFAKPLSFEFRVDFETDGKLQELVDHFSAIIRYCDIEPTSGPKQHSLDDLANKRKQMHSKQYRNQRRP